MTSTSHRLVFRVSRARTLDTDIDVWHASPVDAPIRSGVNGETLSELFEEVEAVKHFILGLPKETPVSVEYVYELPGVPCEVLASYHQQRLVLARATAARLRDAGFSAEDSTTLLDLPESQMRRLQQSA
ncbi:hypothetical protein AB0K60_11300 [Thermopolyspora sp. NPDC052614]|uniref:hypothetical protein n=1 Tax=Thermopolyspora sp. NPDC052614 TaxID=3155682 RepID=UPI00341FC690